MRFLKEGALLVFCVIISICFVNTSAQYSPNIDDTFKAREIFEKVNTFINEREDKTEIKQKIRARIIKMLGESNEYILNKYHNEEKYESIREYALIRIYMELSYPYQNYIARVVENDFIKIIVYESNYEDIKVTDNKIGSNQSLEFFDIGKEEDTTQYIQDNFLGNEYSETCEIVDLKLEEENEKVRILGIANKNLISLSDYQDVDCGEYYHFSRSYFERISPNVLMYAILGQELPPFDMKSMEVKK